MYFSPGRNKVGLSHDIGSCPSFSIQDETSPKVSIASWELAKNIFILASSSGSQIEERYKVNVLMRADGIIGEELWSVTKEATPIIEGEESSGKDAKVAESGGEVVEFPDKKARRNKKLATEKTSQVGAAKRPITVGSILGGLWERIID